MGCGLPKVKRAEDSSPGKIFSTLKRPQVQVKVGVAYTYRFLDFLLGTEEPAGSSPSVLHLSSVRDLPGQLHDLYMQGFVLAAVHPFVHTCGPDGIQRQLHRAVLIRLLDSSEKGQHSCETHFLDTDLVLSAGQFPDPELIQGYVKKVQDVAEIGGFFAGFLHQPDGGHCVPERGEPEDFSLSLHSSPTSALREWSDQSQNQSPEHECGPAEQNHGVEIIKCETEGNGVTDGPAAEAQGSPRSADTEAQRDGRGSNPLQDGNGMDVDSTAACDDTPGDVSQKGEGQEIPVAHQNRVELFALFSHTEAPSNPQRYYTVKVPLRVQLRDEAVASMDANWLDHMTQHFSNGASLVDAYFHLGDNGGFPAKCVESVFVFQEGDPTKPTAYDAIVVEQWTVVDDVEVKADYVPLLQSLALYGWRLTCVLPTPIIKPNSDGSLATKQILFLQRPVLARKNKEPKRLSLRARSRLNKNSVKDVPKNKCDGLSHTVGKDPGEEERIGRAGPTEDEEESEKVLRKNDENMQKEMKNMGEGAKDEVKRSTVEVGSEEEVETSEVVVIMQDRKKGGDRVAVGPANQECGSGVDDAAGGGAECHPIPEDRGPDCTARAMSVEGLV